ncbi:MAG: hypothetical protein RLZZ399_2897 [Verrucomicrobiota bacterium]|jgi:hypothetical protein
MVPCCQDVPEFKKSLNDGFLFSVLAGSIVHAFLSFGADCPFLFGGILAGLFEAERLRRRSLDHFLLLLPYPPLHFFLR